MKIFAGMSIRLVILGQIIGVLGLMLFGSERRPGCTARSSAMMPHGASPPRRHRPTAVRHAAWLPPLERGTHYEFGPGSAQRPPTPPLTPGSRTIGRSPRTVIAPWSSDCMAPQSRARRAARQTDGGPRNLAVDRTKADAAIHRAEAVARPKRRPERLWPSRHWLIWMKIFSH